MIEKLIENAKKNAETLKILWHPNPQLREVLMREPLLEKGKEKNHVDVKIDFFRLALESKDPEIILALWNSSKLLRDHLTLTKTETETHETLQTKIETHVTLRMLYFLLVLRSQCSPLIEILWELNSDFPAYLQKLDLESLLHLFIAASESKSLFINSKMCVIAFVRIPVILQTIDTRDFTIKEKFGKMLNVVLTHKSEENSAVDSSNIILSLVRILIEYKQDEFKKLLWNIVVSILQKNSIPLDKILPFIKELALFSKVTIATLHDSMFTVIWDITKTQVINAISQMKADEQEELLNVVLTNASEITLPPNQCAKFAKDCILAIKNGKVFLNIAKLPEFKDYSNEYKKIINAIVNQYHAFMMGKIEKAPQAPAQTNLETNGRISPS